MKSRNDPRLTTAIASTCRSTRWCRPFPAAERGYVDAVIMPHATRRSVVRALVMLRHKTLERPWKKHANIPLSTSTRGETLIRRDSNEDRPRRPFVRAGPNPVASPRSPRSRPACRP
ncbi:MAG TPA: carboxyl transferase domain-containing protein [Casimicrobiaceae bacterium]|nr:carboxyl transferase domain-containing protein [Casimicrobiaceae bacterium]